MATVKVLKKSNKDIPKMAREICDQMLRQLEKAQRPALEVIKCALDNFFSSHTEAFSICCWYWPALSPSH